MRDLDILESALEKFHFSSTLYCAYCTNRAPWGIRLPASHSVQFHAVRSGHAYIQINGADPVLLQAGDFIVLPHGDAHDVLDDRATEAIPAAELFANVPRASRWKANLGNGGGGAQSELICAAFSCLEGSRHPLLGCLPSVIHLKASETAFLEPVLVCAEREMLAPGRATGAVLARLAEILIVESVRSYIGSIGTGAIGWLSALVDPRIANVMSAIHRDPAHSWTLETLAARGKMSRTTLATRFRAVVGKPVKAYIAQHRMAMAASLLEHPERRGISEVAELVGYTSEAAFSRAFIREMGIAPSAVRRRASLVKSERSA